MAIFKKKAGGTKVGNILRSVKSTVSSVGNKSQGANALQGSYISGSLQKANTNVQSNTAKDVKTYTTQTNQAKALATKKDIIRGGLTGIVTTMASQPNKIKGAMSSLASLSKSGSGGSGGSRTTGTNTLTSIPTTGTTTNNIIPTGSYTGTNYGTGTNNMGTNSSNVPGGSVITAGVLGTGTNQMTFGEQPTPDYTSATPAPVVLSPQDQLAKENEDLFNTKMKNLLADFEDRTTSADIENRLYKELKIKEKQQRVSDLTGQLNAVVNKGQANQLSLVGQGRGIPEAIIGGQQAQIGRETAIAALPIQAQLSAAQGDLEMANDSLDRLFKIYSEEAKMEYDFKREQRAMVYEYLTAEQKRKMEKLDLQETRAYNEKQDLVKTQNDYAKMALANNQGSVYSKIMSLSPDSPTYRQDLANTVSKIYDPAKDLDIQLKRAQLSAEQAKTQGVSGASPSAQTNIDLATSLLDKTQLGKGLKLAVGTGIGRGVLRMNPDRIDFVNNLEKIINSLTLDSFAQAKARGMTFGAMSEAEWQILANSATPIANARVKTGSLAKGTQKVVGYNMSEKSMRDWLKTLSNPEEAYLNTVVDPTLSSNKTLYSNAGY